MQPSLYRQAAKLPSGPGVYLFKNEQGEVLYVGKSIKVKERVKSHLASRGEKARRIVSEGVRVEGITVFSELEALLLEGRLIRKYLPRFNSSLRDDKHPLYIKITVGEEFPKVLTCRREDQKSSRYFGPFPASGTVRAVLRQIRRVFPYCSQKSIGNRGCFYSHIGLCNPCPNTISKIKDEKLKIKFKNEYRRNIRKILLLLRGKKELLEKKLKHVMKISSYQEKFEEAAMVRDQIARLDYITRPYTKVGAYLENPDLVEDLRIGELKDLKRILKPYFNQLKLPKRIECFDVAHISGQDATCSLVTFIRGTPEKNLYRRFRIKLGKSRDDLVMLSEAFGRRLSHFDDWGRPDLFLIDGGRGQVGAIRKALDSRGLDIPTIGLAKRFEEIVVPTKQNGFVSIKLGRDNLALRLLQRLRDEAHRFARSYHFQLRLRSLGLK